MKLPISKLRNNTGQVDGVPANPRSIDKADYAKLLKSIQEDPEYLEHEMPHVIKHDDVYVVLNGNQRLRALKELGYKEVTVTVYPEDTSPEVIKARIIKSNHGYGKDDMEMLGNEWSDEPLTDWGVDLPEDWLEQEGEIEEDEAPEVSDEPPVSKLGEVYQLGRHRVMCADSTVKENVELLMNGEKADMVFTDPPYGMDLDTDYSKLPSTKAEGNKKYSRVIGDDKEYDPTHVLEQFDYCNEIIMFGADYYADKLPKSGSWYVWDKRVEENFDKMIGAGFELAWSKTKHKREIARFNNTLFSGESEARDKVHPTQKPTKMIGWFFERIKGNTVVDLFLGSGSTMVACHQTGRTCYAAEIDPRYVDVSIKRMLKLEPSLELKCNGKIIDKTPWLA